MAYTENSTIGGLTALGEAPASADMVPIWDASAAATRMATVAELLTNAGGGIEFSTAIASLGSETGSVADGDTLLEALAKINDRALSGHTHTGFLSSSAGGEVTGDVTFQNAGSYILPQLRLTDYETGVAMDANTRVTLVSNGTGVASAKDGAGFMLKSDEFFCVSTANTNGASDVRMSRAGAGVWKFHGASSGVALQVEEMTEPDAPATNNARIYSKDIGGKTALMVRFATGAVQQISIEP